VKLIRVATDRDGKGKKKSREERGGGRSAIELLFGVTLLGTRKGRGGGVGTVPVAAEREKKNFKEEGEGGIPVPYFRTTATNSSSWRDRGDMGKKEKPLSYFRFRREEGGKRQGGGGNRR